MAVLKDIESRDPLSEISEQEKELLWTFRSVGFFGSLSKPVWIHIHHCGADPEPIFWETFPDPQCCGSIFFFHFKAGDNFSFTGHQ